MPTSVISNALTGAGIAGITVTARLKKGFFRLDDSAELVGYHTTVTDGGGTWSMALERQSNIVPGGSYWEISEQVADANGGPKQWTIIVPDHSATLLACLAIPLPSPVPSPPPLPVSEGNYEVDTLAERNAITTMITGSFCYVRNIDRIYWYTGTQWTPVGDYARYYVTDFGATDDNVTDCTAAIQAGMDTTAANGGHLYFPINDTGQYLFTTLTAKSGVRMIADQGAYTPQFGYNGTVSLESTYTGNNPAIDIVAQAAFTMVGFLVEAENVPIRITSDDHIRLIDTFMYTRSDTGHADNCCYLAINSFWLDWLGGGYRRAGASNTLPGIILRGTDNPNVNTVNLFTVKRITGARGNIEYQNNITAAVGGPGGRWILEDFVMESLGNVPFLKVTGNNFFKELAHIHFIRCERADSGTTGPGLIWLDCDGVAISNFMAMGVQTNSQYEFKVTRGHIGGGLYIGTHDVTTLLDPTSTVNFTSIVCIGAQFGGLYVYAGYNTAYGHVEVFSVKVNNATSIDASAGSLVEVDDSAPTTVTAINFGFPGQRVIITNGVSHENTTIQHNANLFLAGGANFVMTFHDTIELILNPRTGRWHELCRSVNG